MLSTNWVKNLFLFSYFLLILAACGGGSSSQTSSEQTSSGQLPELQAPTGLSYSNNVAVYTVGTTIIANTPSSGGGAVVSYSVTPTLPAGLALNAITGVVSGTPSGTAAKNIYTVTATNSGGSATATLSITVNDIPPTSLAYSSNAAVYTVGTTIAENTPSSTGGTAISYNVNPALPAGLTLDANSGVISGTPSAITVKTSYAVTAVNSGGTTTSTLSITVNDIPPTSLVYSDTPVAYKVGTAIMPDTPSSYGGAVTSYSVDPALPTGLRFDTISGTITGTPTAATAINSYTVTATNSGGSTRASLSITVNDIPPTSLAYSSNTTVYTVGARIATNTPSSSGGIVTSYSINPALPAGLALDTSSGAISGTPSVITATTSYTVRATNSGGSTTATLSITVNDSPPIGLAYSSNAVVYTVGSMIAENTPSNSGGTVISYSINPALPAGLGLDTTSGVISGTPTTATAITNFTVTGINSGGSTTVTLSITVKDIPPTSLAYSSNTIVYTVGNTIAANNPSNSGGTVTSYSINPGLPAGLALDTGSGVISGTPSTITATTDYTVTATNSGGSTTATLSITINDSPPMGLVYGNNPAVYAIGTAITPNNPSSYGGTVVSYFVSPALPAGLRLDAISGSITGIPTAATATNSYTVTATNSGGSTTATVSITVNPGIFSSTSSPMGTARREFNATLLPNGKVLIAGGSTGSSSLASAELYDAATGSFTATGTMATPRLAATATLLPNGKVLIAGGANDTGYVSSAELYDPTTGSFSAAGAMTTERAWATATLLPNGKLLIAGGYNNSSGKLASAELYDPETGSYSATGTMTTERESATATLLPNGKVLITGGTNNSVSSIGYLSSAELYDPATGTFSSTGSMEVGRNVHTATLLPTGKVLILGGVYGDTAYLTSAELYDPATGNFSSTGSMTAARYDPTATLLPNGKVLIAGGLDYTSSLPNFLATAELYDPTTGSFSPTGSMATGRGATKSMLLPSGKVLIAGGEGYGVSIFASAELYDPQDPRLGVFTATGSMAIARDFTTATLLPNGKALIAGGFDGSSETRSAELYDPAAGTFTTTGPLATGKRDGGTATLLPNGKVLIAGGWNGSGYLTSAELYDPRAGSFSATGSMLIARDYATATLLPNGKVLIAGGFNGAPYSTFYLASAELYDPATGTFTATGSLAMTRAYATATLLPNGKVLIAGGYDGSNRLASAELYDPAAGTFTSTGSLARGRDGATATLLPNGTVLIAGGYDGSSETASAELYDPVVGTFSTTASLVQARLFATATLLPNGTVLIVGGFGNYVPLASAELYDSAAGTFTTTGSLATTRAYATATLLPNGKVLVAGGEGYSSVSLMAAELYSP